MHFKRNKKKFEMVRKISLWFRPRDQVLKCLFCEMSACIVFPSCTQRPSDIKYSFIEQTHFPKDSLSCISIKVLCGTTFFNP